MYLILLLGSRLKTVGSSGWMGLECLSLKNGQAFGTQKITYEDSLELRQMHRSMS